MIRDKQGFTLVETMTALMVFGMLLSVALPVLSELKMHHESHVRRTQASHLLEAEMERIQSLTVSVPSQGERKKTIEGTVYKLRWRKKRVESHLTGSYVEVLWVDAVEKERKQSLKSLTYTP